MDRYGQLNLAGSAVATLELPATARELGLDVVLVQEPYLQALDRIIACGPNPKAGIFVSRETVPLACLHHLSSEHCVVAHCVRPNLYLVSAYFKYSDDVEVHANNVDRILSLLPSGAPVLIGVDSNAHSPMWHCDRRQYVGRGPDVERRRRCVEDLIVSRGLKVWNLPGQPETFCTANGAANIDLTLTRGDVTISEWTVLPSASVSDHRLITFVATRSSSRQSLPSGCAQPIEEPISFRDRGVDWVGFRSLVHERMGRLRIRKPAGELCRQFTNILLNAAREGLGVRRKRAREGYEWWNRDLDALRRKHNNARTAWQKSRSRGGMFEASMRDMYHAVRNTYRKAIEETQRKHFEKLAESGNQDPWGQAYRLASGRVRPPTNVINGTRFAQGHSGSLEEAMSNLTYSLCPDDNLSVDSDYHKQVRLAAAFTPSGRAAPPPSIQDLADIVRRLPNTAPGLDGLTARIIKNVWLAASVEFHAVYEKCVNEGVFPDVWKDGRLLVLPKGNDKELTDPKAYRPITLLPILGKILERVMLKCAPTITSRISECQHGFTRGKSTVTALKALLSTGRNKTSTTTYAQAIFLDISGAFDNAWWPMILVKAKSGGCPPNIYKMLVDYFTRRRVGLFIGDRVLWKDSTMGCPQGSVLGPTLWNVLLDDLLRLPLPQGVKMVAYADDVTLLIEANSRAGIEGAARASLGLIAEWGARNRLEFSPGKSLTMTIRGKFQRAPIIRFGGNSIKSVSVAKVLGVEVDSCFSFAQHASTIGERAAKCFGKMARVSTSTWGIRYPGLLTVYKGTFVATLTYAAAVWFDRAKFHVVRSALLREQRNALILLTKAYRTTSTAALAVLAGVLPADLELIRAGRVDEARQYAAKRELSRHKRDILDDITALWQERWEGECKGRDLFRFFPDVKGRLEATWVVPDYEISQILGGHGCFRKRLHELGLCEESMCACGESEEDVYHILWECPHYAEERGVMLDGIQREEGVSGPVYYRDLVRTKANYNCLREFARVWHARRVKEEKKE